MCAPCKPPPPRIACDAPPIATALFAAYQAGYAISIYVLGCTVVSLVSASLMPDYTGQDISADYLHQHRVAADGTPG
jgi:hypothetical protein